MRPVVHADRDRPGLPGRDDAGRLGDPCDAPRVTDGRTRPAPRGVAGSIAAAFGLPAQRGASTAAPNPAGARSLSGTSGAADAARSRLIEAADRADRALFDAESTVIEIGSRVGDPRSADGTTALAALREARGGLEAARRALEHPAATAEAAPAWRSRLVRDWKRQVQLYEAELRLR